jgi:hypothetical protein
MIPLLGVLAGILLMAISSVVDNNALFLLSSVILLVFSWMYFRK